MYSSPPVVLLSFHELSETTLPMFKATGVRGPTSSAVAFILSSRRPDDPPLFGNEDVSGPQIHSAGRFVLPPRS